MIFLTISCVSKNTVSIAQLKGSWEIDFIEQQGEVFKTNSVTPLYDHYILNEKKGVLNKVAPSMTGIFQTSTNANAFKVQRRKEGFYFMNCTKQVYKNALACFCFLPRQSYQSYIVHASKEVL